MIMDTHRCTDTYMESLTTKCLQQLIAGKGIIIIKHTDTCLLIMWTVNDFATISFSLNLHVSSLHTCVQWGQLICGMAYTRVYTVFNFRYLPNSK